MTGEDVVDVAMETTQDEISSQLAEVESGELGHIEEPCSDCATVATAIATFAISRSAGSPSSASLCHDLHHLRPQTRENHSSIFKLHGDSTEANVW